MLKKITEKLTALLLCIGIFIAVLPAAAASDAFLLCDNFDSYGETSELLTCWKENRTYGNSKVTLEEENGGQVLQVDCRTSAQPSLLSSNFNATGSQLALGFKIRGLDANGMKLVCLLDRKNSIWFELFSINGNVMKCADVSVRTLEPGVWADVNAVVDTLTGTVSCSVDGEPLTGTFKVPSGFSYNDIDCRLISKYSAASVSNGSTMQIDDFYLCEESEPSISFSPADGAENISLDNGTIEVNFGTVLSGELLPEQVNIERIGQQGTETVNAEISGFADKWTLLMPDGVFLPDSTYRITLSEEITDIWGNPAGGVSASFTTSSPPPVPMPEVRLTSPSAADICLADEDLIISAEASAPAGASVARVEFYINDECVGAVTAPPYELSYIPESTLPLEIYAAVYDTNENVSFSESVRINPQKAVSKPVVSDDFEEYSATGEQQAIPAGWSGVIGKGNMYGEKLDTEHGTSVKLSVNASGGDPYLATSDFSPIFSGGSFVCEVDFMPATMLKTEVLTMLSSDAKWATNITFKEDGSISIPNVTNQEAYAACKWYKTWQWYHFRMAVNLDTNSYSLSVNGANVVENAPLQTAGFNTLKNIRITHRYTGAEFATVCYIDNFKVTRQIYYPTVESVSCNGSGENAQIAVKFNTDMKGDFSAVELLAGVERVAVPSEKSYADKILTVKPEFLDTNTEYVLRFPEGISSKDDLPMEQSEISFRTELAALDLKNVKFSSDGREISSASAWNGDISAQLRIANTTGAEQSVTAVLASYRDGQMSGLDYIESTVPSGGCNLPELTAGEGNGAAVYLFNADGLPVCSKYILPGSRLWEIGTIGEATELTSSFNIETGEITVIGVTAPRSQVTLQLKEQDGEKRTAFFGQSMSGSEGYYEFRFTLSEEFLSGAYDAVAVSGGKTETATVLYANYAEAENGLKAINKAKDAQELDLAIRQYYKAFSLSLEEYLRAGSDNVSKLVLENRPKDGYSPVEQLYKVCGEAVCMSLVNAKGNTLSALKGYQNVIGINAGQLEKLPNTQYAVTLIEAQNYERFGQLAEAVQKAIVLTEISYPQNVFSLQTLLTETYAEEIGSFDNGRLGIYQSIKDKQAVFTSMLNTQYRSYEAVISDFENKMLQQKQKEEQSASSSSSSRPGGGGGGGASNGFSASGSAAEAVPAKPQDDGLFIDLQTVSWASESIYALKEMGVLSGDGDGKFRPDDPVLREEFIKMLVTALGLSESEADSGTVFSDVSASHWSSPYIKAAYEHKLIKGKTDGSVGLGQQIKRQEIAAMLYRAKQEKFAEESTETAVFEDYFEIDSYAREAVRAMAHHGIINGTGNGFFEPQRPATRAEAAKMIYSLISDM